MENYDSSRIEKYINCIIPNLTVAVIGLGGTGSIICQSLAHIGIKSFILIDDDIVDRSNISKIVGSSPTDADARSKCNVMADMINRILNRNCDIKTIHKKFNRATKDMIKYELECANFVFVCVDSALGRDEINNFCVRMKKPFIVCGIGMKKEANIVKSMSGQIYFIKPGEPCYECYKISKGNKYGERSIPYIQINSIVANLGIMEFIKHFSEFGETYHSIRYDALKQTTTVSNANTDGNRCDLCTELGYST